MKEEIDKEVVEEKDELVRPLVEEKKIALPKSSPIIIALLIVLAGIGTGFILAQKQTEVLPGGKPAVIKTEKMVGSTDVKTFKDSAEGTLEQGSTGGEGTHKLVRPGGENQTVSLTSSIVNLDDYVGKRVKVWGETFAAQKAGWLMDVGRVEILQ